MRIRFEHHGTAFELDWPPVPEARFKALCGLIAGGLYVGLVGVVAALCGLVGVIVVGVITLFVALISLAYKMQSIGAGGVFPWPRFLTLTNYPLAVLQSLTRFFTWSRKALISQGFPNCILQYFRYSLKFKSLLLRQSKCPLSMP